MCFNPRTHMGCDFLFHGRKDNTKLVSIHAPTWGATITMSKVILSSKVSIHAPTWGATYFTPDYGDFSNVSIHAPTWGATALSVPKIISLMFQSTHPHGVRLPACERMRLLFCFNPRTHMGCDILSLRSFYSDLEFQSTHPHGVRLTGSNLTVTIPWFQSTHPHGVRLHIQQKAEYHIAKVYNLRRKTKRIILT